MMSAAASLGLSLLWDTDIGLSHVDKYTYATEEHIKVRSHIDTSLQPAKESLPVVWCTPCYWFDAFWCPKRFRFR